MFFLRNHPGAGRVEKKTCCAKGHDYHARRGEHGFIGKEPRAEKDHERNGKAPPCGKSAHTPHDDGRSCQVIILYHEGLVDGLKEVIARRHDEHSARDAPEGGEHADDGSARPADDDGKHAEPVLAHEEHERDHKEAQKARHLAQGNHKAVVRSGKAAYFHGVVGVEQGGSLKPQRTAQREQEKEEVHAGIARHIGNNGFHGRALLQGKQRAFCPGAAHAALFPAGTSEGRGEPLGKGRKKWAGRIGGRPAMWHIRFRLSACFCADAAAILPPSRKARAGRGFRKRARCGAVPRPLLFF